jgi:hypothetical protein
MADDSKRDKDDKESVPGRRSGAQITRAEALARLRNATGGVGPDLGSAAERAVADLRLGFAGRAGQIGFLDDVVDFTEDVVDATEELVDHIAGATEELTELTEHITPETTPIWVLTTAILGAAALDDSDLTGVSEPQNASARQLLEVRRKIVEATALRSKALKAVAESLKAQIAAMRGPKP